MNDEQLVAEVRRLQAENKILRQDRDVAANGEEALEVQLIRELTENERLRAALRVVRNLLVVPPATASGQDSFANPYDLQLVIDQALAPPLVVETGS